MSSGPPAGPATQRWTVSCPRHCAGRRAPTPGEAPAPRPSPTDRSRDRPASQLRVTGPRSTLRPPSHSSSQNVRSWAGKASPRSTSTGSDVGCGCTRFNRKRPRFSSFANDGLHQWVSRASSAIAQASTSVASGAATGAADAACEAGGCRLLVVGCSLTSAYRARLVDRRPMAAGRRPF